MRKLWLLIALLFFLAGCSEKPQPAVLPMPMAAPSIANVSMLTGDELGVTCDGVATLAGDSPNYTLSCADPILVDAPTATETPTAVATATETATDTDMPTSTETATSTATATATDTATATQTPSDTPTQTPTVMPTATSTPAPQLTPVASAPLCPTHDDRYWHGLWDAARGCHYDHVHGVDPNHAVISSYVITGVGVMGDMRTLQGGVDFGYVWQTTLENYNKHRGYVGQSAIVPCEQQNYQYMALGLRNCITAFDIVFHHDHGVREGVSRFHSASVHVAGCARDGSGCGDIFTGGLSDTGDLHSPYKTTCRDALGSNRPLCPTDNAVWLNQLNNPPYWAYVTITDALKVLNNGDLARNDPSKLNLPSNRLTWENYSSDRTLLSGNRLGQANRIFHINARDYNSSSYYDPVNRTFGYVCPDSSCLATSDAVYIYTVVVEVPSNLPKVNGLVWFTGYTDRAGRISTSCTAPGVECVPLRIRNMKPGLYIYDMAAPFTPGTRTWGDGVVTTGARYFDVTPPNVPCDGNPAKSCSWIKLPNALGQ